MKMFVPCAELIWIGKLNSTYCMREKGHPGKHHVENCEPPIEAKKEEKNG